MENAKKIPTYTLKKKLERNYTLKKIFPGEKEKEICQHIKKAFVFQTWKCLFFSLMKTQSNKKIIMKIKTEEISKLLT